MSLMHYVKPFLELGICKEYSMARKTTGITTTRSKKKTAPAPPAIAEVVPEVPKPVSKEARRNANAANQSAAMAAPVNLEEEIRRRAYELYLQRRATAGAGSGDENQDWLVAEREVLSRNGGQDQHSA
jgi:hypothetical protein